MLRKYLTLIFLLLFLTSCKVGRMIWYNYPSIKDHNIFSNREILKSEEDFCFEYAAVQKIPDIIENKEQRTDFIEFLKKNKTVAFLVIQKDSILYENYWQEYDEASIVASFSMSKAITSLLIGCAIDEGLINSVDDFVIDYVPELQCKGFEKVKIEHLLQMTSGIKFNEGYANPFGKVATYYYGTDLRKELLKLTLESEPGVEFKYKSGNTELLGLVLERALGDRTISSYLEDKIWQPLGMEYDASWSIDSEKSGLEKTFCCLNARARDFAKIGRLYLNKGNWNGKQIVSEDWVKQSTKYTKEDGSVWYYQYQWWLPSLRGDFMAEGILGQYIYVNPEKELIVVRLGKGLGKADWWGTLISFSNFY